MGGKNASELAGMTRLALRRWERRRPEIWPALAAALGAALLGIPTPDGVAALAPTARPAVAIAADSAPAGRELEPVARRYRGRDRGSPWTWLPV